MLEQMEKYVDIWRSRLTEAVKSDLPEEEIDKVRFVCCSFIWDINKLMVISSQIKLAQAPSLSVFAE